MHAYPSSTMSLFILILKHSNHNLNESSKSSAFMLLLAAVFYLLVFVFSSYYINKQRVVVSSKRDVVRKVYQIEHDLNDNDGKWYNLCIVHAPLIES